MVYACIKRLRYGPRYALFCGGDGSTSSSGLCVSFDSPHDLFRIVWRARRSRYNDSVVPEVEAPSIQQDVLRDICIQFFIDHPAVVGGPGKEVEIDESKFGKRKYNRGRAVEGHWVFGGMERGSGESFLVEVARRDAATLLPIIAQHVRPGTTVYSDEWAAYHQLSTATGNVHLTVNHSLHFVDPVTGAHTQGVESMWSSCKRMMREERAMNSLLFDTYLPEFMWRRKFGGPVAFGHILKHISEQYPV